MPQPPYPPCIHPGTFFVKVAEVINRKLSSVTGNLQVNGAGWISTKSIYEGQLLETLNPSDSYEAPGPWTLVQEDDSHIGEYRHL